MLVSDCKDQMINYEFDKMICYIEQLMGSVKWLLVVVVVNYQLVVDVKGYVMMQLLLFVKFVQVEQFVKDVMGYDEKCGDLVNVVNSVFLIVSDLYVDLLWWCQFDMIVMVKEVVKWFGIVVVVVVLYFMFVCLVMCCVFLLFELVVLVFVVLEDVVVFDGLFVLDKVVEELDLLLFGFENEKNCYECNFDYVCMIVCQDLKIVVIVVKNWVFDEC